MANGARARNSARGLNAPEFAAYVRRRTGLHDHADDRKDHHVPSALLPKGVDRVLPPADYRVVTDEEVIEGLAFVAYHRVATSIFVPAPSGSAVEMVPIDPLDLQAAQERDAPMCNAEPATALKP